jgi:hypothetical protein
MQKRSGKARPRRQDAMLCPVPLFHVTGSHSIFLASFVTGRKLCLMYVQALFPSGPSPHHPHPLTTPSPHHIPPPSSPPPPHSPLTSSPPHLLTSSPHSPIPCSPTPLLPPSSPHLLQVQVGCVACPADDRS